jgi:hypothetical protein
MPDGAERVTNEAFLENYLQFAVFHRWRVAKACLEKLMEFDEEAGERHSLALEISTNLFFAVEDILMWFYVLKAWDPSNQSQNLMDMLDAQRLNPDSRQAALDELRGMSRSAFRTLLKVPNNAQERDRVGVSPSAWKRFKRNAGSLQDNLVEVLANLEAKRENLEDGWLIRCLNKVKHGLVVMKEKPEGQPAVGIFFGGSLPMSESGKTLRLYCPTDTKNNDYMTSQVRLAGKLLAGILAPPFQVVFGREPNVDWPPGWAAS